MSRESAGAAIRTIREARDWSLADLAHATGVSVMGLSYLERGARKPHKGTVQKVENGLGLPPGTYSRLLVSTDPQSDTAQLLAQQPAAATRRDTAAVVVDRGTDATALEGLEGYAEAQLETLNSVITRLPPATSNEYENVVLSVVGQCLKAEQLAANSWRVAVNAGADSAPALLGHVRALEDVRQSLLARLVHSLAARFDRACRISPLPEPVIAGLLALDTQQMWDIRNGGAVPPAALARVRAFTDAALA